MKKALIFAAFAATVSVPAYAAPGNTDTDQGVATAEVVAPITITHDAGASLNFGKFTAGNGGTVVVTRAGNGSNTGDVNLLSDSVESADSFTVTGDASRTFVVSTTDSTVSDGTNTMAFTTNAARNHTLDAAGSATFSVGGTLTVPDGAPAGVYTGSYDATATYN